MLNIYYAERAPFVNAQARGQRDYGVHFHKGSLSSMPWAKAGQALYLLLELPVLRPPWAVVSDSTKGEDKKHEAP